MTTKTIHFELVSPEQKLVSEPVYMAVMPGDEGDFGVLGGHAALVSSLKNGVVKLYREQNDNNPRRIFIAGGFADVTAQNCVVLAEEAVAVSELKRDSLEKDLSELTEDLGLAQEKHDKDRIRGKLAVVRAKLAAIRG
jgi:F-type H+-transporting ATPase subunit epsilon